MSLGLFMRWNKVYEDEHEIVYAYVSTGNTDLPEDEWGICVWSKADHSLHISRREKDERPKMTPLIEGATFSMLEKCQQDANFPQEVHRTR